MAYIFESDKRYSLRRTLLYAIDSYKNILSLKEPLDELKNLELKIKKDHEEYISLQKDLSNINRLRLVKYYIDKYDTDRRSLGDLMEMYGNAIDTGRGYCECLTGRTYNEEYEIVKAAYLLDTAKKEKFRRRYKYLTEKGQADLPVFAKREEDNLTARTAAYGKLTYETPEKQEAKLKHLISDFKEYHYRPTPLYFVKDNLEKHINESLSNNAFDDEYVTSFFSKKDLESIKENKEPNFYTISQEDTEKFISKLAKDELRISDINPLNENENI